jgi:hypothetical protein
MPVFTSGAEATLAGQATCRLSGCEHADSKSEHPDFGAIA